MGTRVHALYPTLRHGIPSAALGANGDRPLSSQEVLADGKRETTTSLLAINPTDLDIGRVFSCRSTNDAVPAGKETFVKLNVHRESVSRAEGTIPAWGEVAQLGAGVSGGAWGTLARGWGLEWVPG